MDWLTFKFCVLISVCVTKSRSQVLNSTNSLRHSNQSQSACEEGQPVPSPDQCNSCICFAGLVYCSNFSCEEQECVNDVEIPEPDPCNKCICRRGKVVCTQMICIPAPDCVEKRLYPSQNECNSCMCLNGFVTCTSNDCTEENLSDVTTMTTTTTNTPQKSEKCIEGSHLPKPNKCVECTCVNGKKNCTNTCSTNVKQKSRFADTSKKECVSGQSIPKPDECNNCICFEGEVHCTHIPCHTDVRLGQECRDDQTVFRPDECNECYCFEGKLHCSDIVCIRGSKCVEGEEIPKPDSCNSCKCIEGHILCTNYQCAELDVRSALRPETSPTDVKIGECQDGDVIPALPPPFECNVCFCIEKRIMCTMDNCVDSVPGAQYSHVLDFGNLQSPNNISLPFPEIKGRLKEENEQNHLEIFDKKISVEPFIEILYKNNDKIPTKVIHTHAYNGFHQEIKVHANHLPKDATGLLKALATTLDNSALASISQKLLTSSHSPTNNHEVVQNNLLGEGNVFTTQSSKLITSGSLSNETILVIPDTEPVNSVNSVIPLKNKHETFWKTVSAPAPTVYHDNNQLIQSRNSREENQNNHHDDRPPKMPSAQHSDIIRNPSTFARPGLPRTFPTKPTPDTLELSNVNTQFDPMLSSKPIGINSGKMNYAPLYQENNNQFKPVPSGFGAKPPGQTPIFNYTLPSPVFGPGKLITPNVNGGQQNPSQSQFTLNPPKYYFNQVKPQELKFNPNQNHPRHIFISNSNNKGIQYPPLFPNTLNQPRVSANQYRTPQFGLQPGQGNPFYNIGNQTDQNLKQYPSNFQIPPVINLPDQNNRISGFEIQASKEKPKFGPNAQQNGVNLQHTQHKPLYSQYIPNPSLYYKHEYEAPKINEINTDEEKPLSKTNFLPSELPSTITEPYNQPHTYSETDHERIIPKVRNKTKKYNTTHSRYEKHTSITYVLENNPNDPAKPIIIGHEPNQDHNAPHSNEIGYYLPDKEAQELDLIIPKVILLDQKEPYDKSTNHNPSQTSLDPLTTDINKYNPHFPGDPKNTDQIQPNQNRTYIPVYPYTHHPFESQFMPLVNNAQKESLNDPNGFQSPTNTVEYPTHQKLPPSQTGPIQNQLPRFQYAHNANQEPLQQKPINELSISKFESPQNNNLPGMLDERGSDDGFQYPSHSTDDPTHSNIKHDNFTNFDPDPSHYDPAHPKDNLHITPQSQFAPTQNKHKPGMIDNHRIKDGYQYAHNANQNPTQLKPLYELSNFLFSPTDDQQNPEMFDEKGSSNSAKNPIQSRGNLNNPQKPQLSPKKIQYPLKSAEHPLDPKEKKRIPLHLMFGPNENQEIIDDRSAGGFRYPSNSAEKSTHPTDPLHNSLYPKEHSPSLPLFDSTQNEHLPNFHYPTNSTKNTQQPNSLYAPIQNQHLPGIFDEPESPNGFQYPSHSAENPLHQKQPNTPYGPTQNQHSPGIPDDRGSAGGFQYPSHSADNPSHQKLPNSSYGPTQNQHSPGILNDRGTAGGFQYPSHSADNPSHQKLPNSSYGPTQNQHSPGILNDRGTAGGFQYPSNSAENPLHQKQPNSPYGPTQNQHSPGMPDDRGSAGGFHYPSDSAENPSQQKPPKFPYSPTQNQHSPGIPDDRESAASFQYPSHSAESPLHQKQPNSPYGPTQNQHSPGIPDDRGSAGDFQYPSHSAENPLHQKQPNSPYGPTQNQHSPGIPDDRESAASFQYPSHSAENPFHQKQPNSPYGPIQKPHVPGIPDDRGSPAGFKYPYHSAENPLHQKQPNSPYNPTQNQYSPGMPDDRGSAGGSQYPSHSAENPSQQKPPNFTYSPTQNQHSPGIPDDRESAASFQYPSQSAENPLHQKKPNSPYGPTQNQHSPGIPDDRGSGGGFQYPSHSAENPLHQKQPNSPYGPTQNQYSPGMPDDRGSASGFQYPSHSAENPSQQKPPNFPYSPTQNQHSPGIPDDRESAASFQYPSHSAENPLHQKKPNSPYGPTQNQHSPGIPDDRGSAGGFQYPSHSAENPLHQKQPNSPYGPTQNQYSPGMPDDRGSAGGFQYPSHSAENPSQQKPPNIPYSPTQNQHSPGIPDDRESAASFQYPSHSAENPLHQKKPNSPYGSTQNQHSLGIPDDRGSAGGFQYPSHSAENPLHQKQPNSPYGPTQNQYSPGMPDDRGSAGGFQYPSHSAENPSQQKQPNFLYNPTQNQHSPGILDERGSADGFQYPSHSADNPSHAKHPISSHGPTQNQHAPGILNERGSDDGIQYPSHSTDDTTHPKDKLTHRPLFPIENQHLLEIFGELGHSNGSQHPFHSTETPLQIKDNQHRPLQSQFLPSHNRYKDTTHKQPYSLFSPNQNQHLPGMFDERGSSDGFQFPSHTVDSPLQTKDNRQHPLQSQFLPSHNQYKDITPKQPDSLFSPNQNKSLPGMFDERGSSDGFQFPSHTVDSPLQTKDNRQHPLQSQFLPSHNHYKDITPKQPDSLFSPNQNKSLPGMFDERGSSDGFQYPSHTVDSPLQTKDNRQHSLQSQFLPSHNQYKDSTHNQPDLLFSPNQNKTLPGMFDERGSSDGFQYPSHTVESPLQTKDNRQHPLQSQFLPSHNQYKDSTHNQPDLLFSPNQNKTLPGMFDERGSSDGFQYPSHTIVSPLQTKDNRQHPLQSQFLPSHNQYKDNTHKIPNSPYGLAQNQYLPAPHNKLQSSPSEDPTLSNGNIHDGPHPQLYSNQKPQNNSIHKQPEFPFGPPQIHDLPEVFEEVSQSTNDPTLSKTDPDQTPVSKLTPKIYNEKANKPDQIPYLHTISPTSNNYNNNNPLRPLMHLENDQYKPSSFDNLLNGVHNIPWSVPDDYKVISNIVSSTPQPEFESHRDESTPSSLDNLINGVHNIPLPENHKKVLNTITSAPKGRFKPEHDQYKPWSLDNSLNGIHQIPWPIPNQDSVTDAEITTPSYTNSDRAQINSPPETKPDGNAGKVLPIDDDDISNYYDQLYPLLNAVKKLSELPFNESALTVDQLDLSPDFIPKITKILKILNPENDRANALTVENNDFQSPWSTIKSKIKQLPVSGDGILNWLQSKLNKLVPIKYNITAITNNIDMPKIFNLLSKLTGPKINDNAVPQNISFSSLQEDTLTTTSLPRTDATHSYDNRIKTDPTELEENQTQAPQVKYPDVHIILHQPNDQDDLDLSPFIEADGVANLPTNINSEELGTLFSKMFNPRFKHRPKDQKDECGDGTYWISNCHGCSCYFGRPMCFKMNDCELRPFGKPMPCKPYSHFKMGCYTCECNGDGVAECDAKDCDPTLNVESNVSEAIVPRALEFKEFFDSKKTDEILQYYNTYKKLPKYCPEPPHPTCAPGTSWISTCHKCECNETGKHECNIIDGCKLDFDSYGKPSRCKPNSKFYPKTNSLPCVECSCDDEGKSYCPAAE